VWGEKPALMPLRDEVRGVGALVGLVTLMGLVNKHAILIVKFANDLRAEGWLKREAIEEAAALRLHPICRATNKMRTARQTG